MQEKLSSRVIGFVGSLILTSLAFLIVARPSLFDFKKDTAVVAILTLALFQFVVQSIFFLNLLDEKGPRWNLLVFLSTLSIIVIIVAGSIWIMQHLDYNMMLMVIHGL